MADSYVCSGAMMKCTMGSSPAKLTVLPSRTVFLAGQPQANISDHKSMVNLAPFGVCRSLAFPPTASATAAAMGTLTPMPCIHNTPAPWFVGKMDTLIKGQPALLQSCKCQCMWGGTITLINNGQVGEGAQDVNEKPKGGCDLHLEDNYGLDKDSVLDGIQLALDAAGFVPGFGAIPDLINASISALRGNWTDAGLSLLAAVPLVGDAAAGVKIAKKGVKIAKDAKKGKSITKESSSLIKKAKKKKNIKDPYRRPSGFRKGVRKKVWEDAKKKGNGKVYSPDGIEIKETDKWDMGHRPGYEFRKHQESARRRGISRKQFLDEYNNPDHYRPETPSFNRSHKGELKGNHGWKGENITNQLLE